MKHAASGIVLLILVGLWGCASAPEVRRARRAAQGTALPQYALTPAQTASFATNCPSGTPILEPTWDHGPVRPVARAGYALVHSSVDLIPLFVCEGITVAQISGPLPRPEPEPFRPEPDLPTDARAELADYRNSGYDRGHMAPSADQTVDATLQADTFYLSNMAPQVGVGFNRSRWMHLEDTVRGWLRSRGGGWILTGPLFFDPEEEDPATRDGVIDYFTVGGNAVAVPTHFYKIVVAESAGGTEAIAFVYENRAYPNTESIAAHVVAIDWIEARTGLDFLPDLDAATQVALESAPAGLWQ